MILFRRVGFYYEFSGANLKETKIIRAELSLFEDNCFFAESFRKKRWDGYIRFYKLDSFLYGFLRRVCKVLDENSIEYKIESTVEKEVRFDISELDKRLYEYQKEAVKTILNEKCGIIKVPTRGGKTFIIGEILRCVDKKSLVIVDSLDLFSQIRKELEKYLGFKIGVIKGENRNYNERVVITTIQTLFSLSKKKKASKYKTLNDLEKKRRLEFIRYLESVETLIIDEIHEYSSPNRIDFIKSKFFSVEYLVGLSATPYRSEKKINNMWLEGMTGGVVYEIGQDTLIKQGVLTQYKVLCLYNTIENDCSRKTFREVFEDCVIYNEVRNNMLVAVVLVCESLGLKILVLFSSVKHGQIIAKMLGKEFISGKDDLLERERVKDVFLHSINENVLLASNIYKKGVTLPEVNVLLNANGGKEHSLILQRIGRILGRIKGKECSMVIDIMDDVHYLSDHSIERMEVYQNTVPLEYLEAIGTQDNDFYKNLNGKIKRWFNR